MNAVLVIQYAYLKPVHWARQNVGD